MSNRVSLDATKFVNKNGDESYGYRMYDDYDQTYYNCAESNIMEMDDLELLEYAGKRADERAGEMISFCMEEEKGMYINDTWYDHDEIKDKLNSIYA